MNTNLMTVETLRKSGYKVRVNHYRNVSANARTNGQMTLTLFRQGDKVLSRNITAKGGKTEIHLTFKDKTVTGTAECSIKDGYNKKIGVAKALGRAMSNLLNSKIISLTPAS